MFVIRKGTILCKDYVAEGLDLSNLDDLKYFFVNLLLANWQYLTNHPSFVYLEIFLEQLNYQLVENSSYVLTSTRLVNLIRFLSVGMHLLSVLFSRVFVIIDKYWIVVRS